MQFDFSCNSFKNAISASFVLAYSNNQVVIWIFLNKMAILLNYMLVVRVIVTIDGILFDAIEVEHIFERKLYYNF